MPKDAEIYRCAWAHKPIFHAYHDTEWGVPCHDDRKHFEYILLDNFQAGLSWEIILRKRDGFRNAFADFDPHRIARFNATDIQRLCSDASIVRNKLKIQAAINNAHAFLAIQKRYHSFDAYIWQFTNGKVINNMISDISDCPTRSDLSDTISTALKAHGFKFVGSVITYAYLEGVGIINDHEVACFRHREVARATQ